MIISHIMKQSFELQLWAKKISFRAIGPRYSVDSFITLKGLAFLSVWSIILTLYAFHIAGASIVLCCLDPHLQLFVSLALCEFSKKPMNGSSGLILIFAGNKYTSQKKTGMQVCMHIKTCN